MILVMPEYITFNNWACSLLTTYSRYNIPLLLDENDWKKWAEDLLAVPPFRGKNIPSPSSLTTSANENDQEWQPWARAFYLCVNKLKLD